VFKSLKANKCTSITHRIVAIGSDGIITKGDNNPRVDDGPITPDEIVGIVLYARRGNRTINIYNGKCGLVYARIMHFFMRFKSIILRFLSFPYHIVSKSGILRGLMPGNKKLRIIYINRPSGIESQLIMGKYIIGKRSNENWVILPPFKLFIDETTLPKNDTPSYDPQINNDNISL
jgi:hypothetical protein